MMVLGRFHYPQPVVVLAPMAGISDYPFRRLCQNLGADWTVAEMVSARPELFASAASTRRLRFDDDSRFPKVAQLLAADPELAATAAQWLQDAGADIIDINAGCPAQSIGRQGAGSALLSDLPRLARILKKVVAAVRVPVTLKTRLGDRDINLATVGALAQDCGVALIAVHGRTRAQKFTGTVAVQPVAELKAKLAIPVLFNGDIRHADAAQTLITRYGFDGVMIGRAAKGNPWLFAACKGRAVQPNPRDVMTHLRGLWQHYGPQAVRIARQHLHAYYAGHPRYAQLRSAINTAESLAAQREVLRSFPLWESV